MTAVVLLHAFPVNHHLWEGQIEYLRGVGYTVFAPDLGGFGDSALPGSPSLLQMVTPVLTRLTKPAVFVGVSMGGYLLMEVLRKAADRVAGAIFVDTKATADAPEARRVRFQMAQRMDGAQDTAGLADELLPNLLGATTRESRPDVVRAVRQMIDEASPAAVANAQRTMADRLDSVPVLRGYDGLAAVVWGSEDTISPRAEQQIMLDAMPQAVGREIPGAGHLSVIEDPAAANDVLLEILRDWLA